MIDVCKHVQNITIILYEGNVIGYARQTFTCCAGLTDAALHLIAIF